MKKYLLFISLIFVLFLGYCLIVNKPKSYEIEYIVKEYNIIEKYDKDSGFYNFTLDKDDISFNFVSNSKYSSNRKLIKDVSVEETGDALCVKPISSIEGFEYVCHTDNGYVDQYLAGLLDKKETKKINRVANVDIYDNEHQFMIWNNKGLPSLLENREYTFLKTESFDNLLTYQWQDYVIVADYDQLRNFNQLYIYNNRDKKIDKWELGVNVSFEAYFMGDLDNLIYLFDQKNKVQYSLDIKSKKIKVTSDKEGAIYYDKELTQVALDKLVYNQMTFIKENKYNFILYNDKLYLRLYGSDQNILITDQKIDHIVHVSLDEVYYLVDEKLYSYAIGQGERLLLINFEWNFTYLNKIFIFD